MSWWREVGKLFLLYLAAGAAFVPWGAVYSLFLLAGWDHWIIAVLMLAGGFATAHFVWRMLEKRLMIQVVEVVRQTILEAHARVASEGQLDVVEIVWPEPIREIIEHAVLAGDAATELFKQAVVANLPGEFKFVKPPADPSQIITPSVPKLITATGSSETILLPA